MSEDIKISTKILELVSSSNPATVEQLIDLTEKELGISKEIALKHIIELENLEKIRFTTPPELIPKRLGAYLFSTHATWFWSIIALSIAATITVYSISEKAIPFVYVRYLLGSIFVLFLPGFSLIKILFPMREIDIIERIALSVGASIALVPLVGLLLNNTPWGINLTAITLSLLGLTIILAIAGLLREHEEKIRNPER